ncbi:Gfo/Idh/MocA family oxidoreductase [Rhodococcus sp. T2V]|uniref:Gfo/Idh/MocA family protein n=1 Tax=Rhodococcus sp. T2V TaxID=3034164 RepID=UPI0023E278B9|nr:Gfo/Idh/MocA family oxidoreductase [Rhodococcus sp. T2V]MDF3313229.1 Gfo/Idh/MocA family oxidoreductase [Rhodococcus sp. T2V]
MSGSNDLRIAVLGVGMMGADHVARITDRIKGATVAVVNDYFTEKAEEIAAGIPGCRVVNDPLDAIADPGVDAVVLATPGPTHEKQLLACLEHGKPVMCEKPLTTDVATSLEIVKAEAELGKKLIQVGFMRRFDHEYEQLKSLIDDGVFGRVLLAHCVHRNPVVPPSFDSSMIVKDSLVHEVDVTRFLFDEEITSVHVLRPAANPGAPEGLQDPQIAFFSTESGRHVDVELFVTTGVAYEVRTEIVAEKGSAFIGLDVGLVRKYGTGAGTGRSGAGMYGGEITPSFKERFGQAYDVEIQRWVNAVRTGAETGNYVDGPGAWDGYAAAAVCAAGVQSLETGERVTVEMVDRSSIPGAEPAERPIGPGA